MNGIVLSRVWLFAAPWIVAYQAPLFMGILQAKYIGVCCFALLQGIFPDQGSNPGLPHCRRIVYHLSQQECPWILQWVAYPISRETSWPRNQTRVSCIAGRFSLHIPDQSFSHLRELLSYQCRFWVPTTGKVFN